MSNKSSVLSGSSAEQTITITVTRSVNQFGTNKYKVSSTNGLNFDTHYPEEIGTCIAAIYYPYKNLKAADRQTLLDVGYLWCDLPQIDQTFRNVVIYYFDATDRKHLISSKRARQYLGERNFWASIGRTVFHSSSCNDGNDEEGNPIYIHFNCK